MEYVYLTCGHWFQETDGAKKGRDILTFGVIAWRESKINRTHFALLQMFICLKVPTNIFIAIIDEQNYYDPFTLSCLKQKYVKQLVAIICRPGGTNDEE